MASYLVGNSGPGSGWNSRIRQFGLFVTTTIILTLPIGHIHGHDIMLLKPLPHDSLAHPDWHGSHETFSKGTVAAVCLMALLVRAMDCKAPQTSFWRGVVGAAMVVMTVAFTFVLISGVEIVRKTQLDNEAVRTGAGLWIIPSFVYICIFQFKNA